MTAPTIGRMDQEAPRQTKRLRLNGERFRGGRLPVDSLLELQSYQEAVRAMAVHEWAVDHAGESPPESIRGDFSLTIERIDDGSADVFLAFERVAVYQEYQEHARDAVDALVQAAYSGDELPDLPSEAQESVRSAVAGIGRTLEGDQSIEFYVADDSPPVLITVETRREAVGHLLTANFFLDAAPMEVVPSLQTIETTLVAHVVAIDADRKVFLARDLESRRILGWYKDTPDLLEDLRAVVDAESEGPLTRISGQLQYRDGEPWRFRPAVRIERVEFDDAPWGRALERLVTLPAGWASGGGSPVTSVALDAAQAVMRNVVNALQPTIGATEEGGVLIEWIGSTGIRSIEVLPDGTFELFEMQREDRRGTETSTLDARRAASFASGASE